MHLRRRNLRLFMLHPSARHSPVSPRVTFVKAPSGTLLLRHPGPWSTVLSHRTFLILVQCSVYWWHQVNLHSVTKETGSPGIEKPSLKSRNPGSQSITQGPPRWTQGQEYNNCILSLFLEGVMVFWTGWQLREIPKGGHPCADVHTSGQMWF